MPAEQERAADRRPGEARADGHGPLRQPQQERQEAARADERHRQGLADRLLTQPPRTPPQLGRRNSRGEPVLPAAARVADTESTAPWQHPEHHGVPPSSRPSPAPAAATSASRPSASRFAPAATSGTPGPARPAQGTAQSAGRRPLSYVPGHQGAPASPSAGGVPAARGTSQPRRYRSPYSQSPTPTVRASPSAGRAAAPSGTSEPSHVVASAAPRAPQVRAARQHSGSLAQPALVRLESSGSAACGTSPRSQGSSSFAPPSRTTPKSGGGSPTAARGVRTTPLASHHQAYEPGSGSVKGGLLRAGGHSGAAGAKPATRAPVVAGRPSPSTPQSSSAFSRRPG